MKIKYFEAKKKKKEEAAKKAAKKKALEQSIGSAVGTDYNSSPFTAKTKSNFVKAFKYPIDIDIRNLKDEFNSHSEAADLIAYLRRILSGSAIKSTEGRLVSFSKAEIASSRCMLLTSVYLFLAPAQRSEIRHYIKENAAKLRAQADVDAKKIVKPGTPPPYLHFGDYVQMVDYLETGRFDINAASILIKCDDGDIKFDDKLINDLVVRIIKKRDSARESSSKDEKKEEKKDDKKDDKKKDDKKSPKKDSKKDDKKKHSKKPCTDPNCPENKKKEKKGKK